MELKIIPRERIQHCTCSLKMAQIRIYALSMPEIVFKWRALWALLPSECFSLCCCSVFVFGGSSLRVHTSAPSSPLPPPVNTTCAFHFSHTFFPSRPSITPLPPLSLPPVCSLIALVASCPIAPLVLCPLVPVQSWNTLGQELIFLKPSNTHVHVSSIHDCDRYVYNVIRLRQTCLLSAIVHL